MKGVSDSLTKSSRKNLLPFHGLRRIVDSLDTRTRAEAILVTTELSVGLGLHIAGSIIHGSLIRVMLTSAMI